MHGWCWWAKLLVGSPLMHPITFLLFNPHSICSNISIFCDLEPPNLIGFPVHTTISGDRHQKLFFIRATKRASFPLQFFFFSIRSNCLMTFKKTCDSLNLEIVKVQQTGKLHTWRFYFVHFVQSDKYHVFVNLFPR